jgi:hypothetical protein
MFYYSTPNYSVALNAKVGSTAMARALIRQFYPRLDWLIRTAAFPAGVTEADRPFHWMCPGSRTPDKPVVLLVRDPVDRFITACQQVGISTRKADAAIASLVEDKPFARSKPSDITPERWAEQRERAAKRVARMQRRDRKWRPDRLRADAHFFHQYQYAVGPTTCFRFPRDIAAAAAFIGIDAPLPELNRARREKPTLTKQEADAVRAYYAVDQALFDAIAQAGYVYTPPA